MRLISLRLQAYKRFADAKVRLDGDVIAVVGPNEAGKSSLLLALEHLGSTDPINPGDVTRGLVGPAAEPRISARFLLEEEDRKKIGKIPQAAEARWYVLEKGRDGQRTHDLEPRPVRDLAPRESVIRRLQRFLGGRWAEAAREGSGAEGEPESPTSATVARLDAALEALTTQSDELGDPIIKLMSEAADAIESLENPPRSLTPLADQLRALAAQEASEPPNIAAANVAFSLLPKFLLFDQEDRYLESNYAFAGLDSGGIAPALQNLLDLAKVESAQLLQAARDSNQTEIERIERDANERLAEVFAASYGQAQVAVRLRIGDAAIHILVSNVAGGYTSIAERSDGLRAFVALLAYIHRHADDTPPILLIDEAETHLHYDAQADLVRVLERQGAASQVIYTTHSAGCLPEDLGTGVRGVVREEAAERSTIRDSFWVEGAGFSPLVLSMGANALAFSAARRAAIAEGASDMILLPTLLREANQVKRLGFQIAPGLAEATPDTIRQLDLEAAMVAYVLDNDAAGRVNRARLRNAGIPADRILMLGEGSGEDWVLEDLVRPEAYAAAVNEELRRSGRAFEVSTNAVNHRGRPTAVEQICAAKGVPPPGKVAVAYRLVEAARDGTPLLTGRGRQMLLTLYSRLRTVLRVD